MPSVSLFGAAPRVTNIVLREQFTGDGSDTTFQLTSSPGNCTFNKGSWAASHIQTAYPAHCTGTDKKPTYDSTVYLVRNRIGVTSIDASGLVTLDNAPRNGVNFYVWYWYQLQPIDEIDTYREDFVASMEAEAAAYGDMIALDVSNFDGILSATDTTVQQAMETIDDHLHDGQTLECDGINSDGGAFPFTTSGTLTFSNTINLSTCANAGVDTDKFLVLDASGNVDFRTGAEVLSDIGGGGGGGNNVYVEEGDTARADSSGADLYIDFDNDDFDVGVVGNECNITLNDGGHVHDGATLQHDGVNSDGGAFSFTTSGKVTFSQSVNLDTVGTDQFEIGGNRALAMPVDNTNMAMGYQAGNALSSGTRNMFAGYQAGYSGDSTDCVALGWKALYYNTSGTFNSAFGSWAMYGASGVSTGAQNTAFGYHALYSCEDGDYNTAIGAFAGEDITSGNTNVAIGHGALSQGVVISSCVAIGDYALGGAIPTASSTVAIGNRALRVATSASGCVAIGASSQYSNSTGNHNTSIGYASLRVEASGGQNSCVGESSLEYQNGGAANVAVGYYASRYNVTGDYNTAVGSHAMRGVSSNSHSNNVAVGYRALYAVTTGGNNICVGYNAGDVITTGAGNIIIGYNIDPSGATVNDELNIGGALFGILDDGNIGIGGQTFDATARNVFQIVGSTEPSGSITDAVQLYERDSSQGAGHGTLGIYTEEAVEVIGTFTPSHKLRIWHNGTEYHIQLDAV